jgi:hypothetical protein
LYFWKPPTRTNLAEIFWDSSRIGKKRRASRPPPHFFFFLNYYYGFIHEPLILFGGAFQREGIRQDRFAFFYTGDYVGTAVPVGFGEVGFGPLGGVVGVGMVEADDVFSALAGLALDFDQLFGVDVVTVVGGVGAGVAGSGYAGDYSVVVLKLAEQDSAAFVGVGFFAVLAEGFVEWAGDR